MSFIGYDEGNVDNYAPRVLGDRLIGPDDTGVDELDRNGRSLNHPVPSERCSKSGCVTGSLYSGPWTHSSADSRSVFKNPFLRHLKKVK
jgi:hypothetical protein